MKPKHIKTQGNSVLILTPQMVFKISKISNNNIF